MDIALKKRALNSFFSLGSFGTKVPKPYRYNVYDRFIPESEPVVVRVHTISENLGSAFAEVNSLMNDAVECCSDERK